MKGVTLANLERSRFFEEEPLSPSETKIEVDLLILGGIAIITSCPLATCILKHAFEQYCFTVELGSF